MFLICSNMFKPLCARCFKVRLWGVWGENEEKTNVENHLEFHGIFSLLLTLLIVDLPCMLIPNCLSSVSSPALPNTAYFCCRSCHIASIVAMPPPATPTSSKGSSLSIGVKTEHLDCRVMDRVQTFMHSRRSCSLTRVRAYDGDKGAQGRIHLAQHAKEGSQIRAPRVPRVRGQEKRG
jgi:hypothetical protein